MSLIEITEPHPGVRQWLFNRPDKLNALSGPMLAELDRAIDAAEADAAARVVVLCGAGGKAFVAGADIAEYRGDRRAEFVAYQLEGRRLFDRIERLSKPTICAIEGYALGGGFEIALCCDIIVCADNARLGLPEGRLGLCPGGGGTQRLTRAVGKYAASEVMLAGWQLDAHRAHALGIVAEIATPEALGELALARSRACLKVAPLAQAQMKRLIREGADAPIETAKSLEQETLFRLYGTRDGREGIAAFLDKRQPVFEGA